MKKKIKDLTLEEAKEICENHSCSNCSLNSACCIANMDERYLEKEIEVEE